VGITLMVAVVGCGLPAPTAPSAPASDGPPVTVTPSASMAPAAQPPELAWTEVPIDPDVFDGAVVSLIVAGNGTVVAFGRDSQTTDPLVWTSVDGASWSRQPQSPSTFGGGSPDAAVGMPGGFVAVGWGPDPAHRRREFWTSPDGSRWTRSPYASARPDDGELTLTSFGDVVLARGSSESRDVTLRSTDGQHWLDVSELVPRGYSTVAPVADARGFVAVGGDGTLLTIFRSDDGIDWSQTAALPEAWPGAIGASASGLVIVGASNLTGSTTSTTWMSVDDGVEWGIVGGNVFDDPNAAALRTVGDGLVGLSSMSSDADTAFSVVAAIRDQRLWARGSMPVTTLVAEDWKRMSTVIDGELYLLAYDGATGRYRAFRARFKDGSPTTPRPSISPPLSFEEDPTARIADLVWHPIDGGGVLDEFIYWGRLAAIDQRVVLVGQTVPGPSAIAMSTDGGLHWRSVPTPAALQNAIVGRLRAVDGRFFAVGEEDGQASIWTSPDGTHWTRQRLGKGIVSDVAVSDGRWVAVGAGDEEDGLDGMAAISWTSDDGTTWSRAYLTDGASFDSVAAGGPGWIAGGGTDRHAMVWKSSDGITWTKSVDDTAFSTPGADYYFQGSVTDIVRVGTGYVAVGGVGRVGIAESLGTVFTSPDGLTWQRATDGLDTLTALPTRLLATPDGLVFVTGESSSLYVAAAWTSVDGQAWSEVDRLDQTGSDPGATMMLSDATLVGDRLLAVGRLRDRAALFIAAPRGTVLPDRICPNTVLTLSSFASLSPAARLACAGDAPLTLRAWAKRVGGGCGSTLSSEAYAGTLDDLTCAPSIELSATRDGPVLLSIELEDEALARRLARPGWFSVTLSQGVVDDACRDLRPPGERWAVLRPTTWGEFECAIRLRVVRATRSP